MSLFGYLIPFVLAFSALIFFHELGHYLLARWCGVKVERFSIGFGRPLVKWTVGADRTEWVLAAIPLGGYVKMLDEREAPVDDALLHRAFNRQPVWRRFVIILAGPLANLLLALLLFWGLSVAGTEELRPQVALLDNNSIAARAGIHNGDTVLEADGVAVRSWSDLDWVLFRNAVKKRETVLRVQTLDGAETFHHLNFSGVTADENLRGIIGLRPWPIAAAVAGEVRAGSAAARAGIQPGDVFTSLDGERVASWDMLTGVIRQRAGVPVGIEVLRDGRALAFTLIPDDVEDEHNPGKRIGQMGVQLAGTEVERFKAQRAEALIVVRYGVAEGVLRAAVKTWEMSAFAFETIVLMLTGELSWKNLAGPVTIADYAGQTAKMGLSYFLKFVALISISIGILNLLPIPVLDGGHLLYYTIEIIKGSPVSEHMMEIGQRIGLAALFMLMALAFYNDIYRLLSG